MDASQSFIKEVSRIQWFMKWVWPTYRRLVFHKLMERCQKCILPESYCQIINGICDECRKSNLTVPTQTAPNLDHEFSKFMDEVKKHQNSLYDAIVLFSGGKDSTYMLVRILKEYPKLRLLALTIDNTFMSPVALSNVKRVIERLGVDHIVARPQSSIVQKMFAYALCNLNNKGFSGTVDQFDGDFFCDFARNIAHKLGVAHIFVGLSRVQVERILKLKHFHSDPAADALPRLEVAGLKLDQIFEQSELEYWWQGGSSPQLVFPFYVWNPEEEDIKKKIFTSGLLEEKNLDPMLTNHQLIPLSGIVDMHTLGYSSFEAEFAEAIRNQKADRKKWLHTFELIEYAAKTGHFIGDSVDKLLLRLNIKKEQIGFAKPSALQNKGAA